MKPKQKPIAGPFPLSLELIKRRIYVIRGREVMLDSDLAELYQVPTKALNQAVRRNLHRFPEDFMFQLSNAEFADLRSQFVTSSLGLPEGPTNRSQFVTDSQKHRDPQSRPLAFTEHGVAMLSSVLKSRRAVQMNIFIIRAFIQLRRMLAQHEELSKRLQKVEGKVNLYGQVLTGMVADIKRMKNPPLTKAIGFEYRPKFKHNL